jgi:hypothetical protein
VRPRAVSRAAAAAAELGDLRFRAIAGEAAWGKLPQDVRRRFSKRIGCCETALFAGEVVECRMSRAGRIFAQCARLIGAPLPLEAEAFRPAAVAITEDAAGGGQFWTRIYGRGRGHPQVIHSAKRFWGPTGLEEHVGGGFGIALRVVVSRGAIHFLSDHYFLNLGRLRIRLPRWLSPGLLRVSHVDCGDGGFAFVMVLRSRWFGALIRQTAMFRDCAVREE